MTLMKLAYRIAPLVLLAAIWTPWAAADEKAKAIALGRFQVDAPADWEARQPKSRIIAYEFAAPASEGDDEEGRLTVMAAGGGIEANIERWYTQWKQPDGSPTKDRAKVDREKIAGQEVYIVDISGTYLDRPAPFARAPAVERENYRMLAAIIATDEAHFFFKFYGPRKTISDQRDQFLAMVRSLRES